MKLNQIHCGNCLDIAYDEVMEDAQRPDIQMDLTGREYLVE